MSCGICFLLHMCMFCFYLESRGCVLISGIDKKMKYIHLHFSSHQNYLSWLSMVMKETCAQSKNCFHLNWPTCQFPCHFITRNKIIYSYFVLFLLYKCVWCKFAIEVWCIKRHHKKLKLYIVFIYSGSRVRVNDPGI